jgi:hypothetical protein
MFSTGTKPVICDWLLIETVWLKESILYKRNFLCSPLEVKIIICWDYTQIIYFYLEDSAFCDCKVPRNIFYKRELSTSPDGESERESHYSLHTTPPDPPSAILTVWRRNTRAVEWEQAVGDVVAAVVSSKKCREKIAVYFLH